jgi:CheY-like chemotaxis protein
MMRVLIADDDGLAREFLTAVCRSGGWDVQTAVDAMQAVMFAAREPRPDVVLLDLKMPAGTGTQALQRLKTSVRTSQIPIIVVSGAVEGPEAVERLKEQGAFDVIRKPPDPAALLSVMAAATGGRSGPE